MAWNVTFVALLNVSCCVDEGGCAGDRLEERISTKDVTAVNLNYSLFLLFSVPFSFPLLAWPCQSAAASSHCSPLLLWWESSGEGMVWQPKAHPCYRAKPEPSLNQGSKTEVEARLGVQFWLYLVSWRLLLKRKSLNLRRLFLLRPVAVWISAIRSVCCWDWNETISISN